MVEESSFIETCPTKSKSIQILTTIQIELENLCWEKLTTFELSFQLYLNHINRTKKHKLRTTVQGYTPVSY